MPEPQPGRDALLASIQGKSVRDLRKTDTSSPSPGAAAAAAPAENKGDAGGGGDLASALASALNERKGQMGDSDEEESEEDW